MGAAESGEVKYLSPTGNSCMGSPNSSPKSWAVPELYFGAEGVQATLSSVGCRKPELCPGDVDVETILAEPTPPPEQAASSRELPVPPPEHPKQPQNQWSSTTPPAEPKQDPPPPPTKEYRMRFYNFNLGNNSSFNSVSELQGPGGRGQFVEAMIAPLNKHGVPDIIFATLVETRLNMSEWVNEYLARNKDSRLDSVLAQNARREGAQNTKSYIRTLVEGLAASYNGNLKSMLIFGSDDFHEDEAGGVFGRLTEATIVGLPVPNPKKAFMGRTVVEHGDEGLRLCFVGAHFPIAKLAAALEDQFTDPLYGAKLALAGNLRKVLRNACERGVVNDRTAIILQGDLNSRTVIRDSAGATEASDVLLDLLADDTFQSAIQHELPLPAGRWREIVEFRSVNDLPVTYKFKEENGCKPGQLTVGDVLAKSRDVRSEPSARQESESVEGFLDLDSGSTRAPPVKQESLLPAVESYRSLMLNVGDEQLTDWGLAFKKHDFRAFRFPACADRVIYWAPDKLADRMSWELPRGGYEVNHGQLGSDHRPVSLDVVLTIAPEPIRMSKILPQQEKGDVFRTISSMAESEAEDDTCEDVSSPAARMPKSGAR